MLTYKNGSLREKPRKFFLILTNNVIKSDFPGPGPEPIYFFRGPSPARPAGGLGPCASLIWNTVSISELHLYSAI